MNKYAILFDYIRQCPQLYNLWSIAATEDIGVNVILPQGASPTHQYQERTDALGNYLCEIVPYLSVYEDFQVNCYRWYDVNDSTAPARNENVLSLQDVEKVCQWVKAQNDANNFPEIGEQVVSIECNPFVPQIRYVNPEENTVGYYITIRLRYVNRENRKTVEYGYTD